MSSRPIVTLDGVTKSFGSFKALHETSFSIGEGEFVTLLGPSGCGKTTTLRLIGGFELPTTGKIGIAGQDVTHNPPYRRPVNTVFQDYALFPHMTVAENVAYGLTVRGSTVARSDIPRQVGEVLEMVGLSHMGGKRPGALSGGQKQRVAMARALIRKPRVLLLDEPLSALDVKLREVMQVELKRLHRELGITFLMVTHDQTEALALSNRIVVMEAGRIRQIGTPNDLYDRPATPYVADFIGATNLIEARYEGREAGFEVITLPGGAKLRRKASGNGFHPGSEVLIGIRPEHLSPAVGDNLVQGRVVDTLFHGDSIRLEFLPDGATQPAFAQLARGSSLSADALMPGQPIRFAVAPEDVMLFPKVAA
ncbi:ABC-type Fe3+/spermidine/putrescine transport system ATPase subunit [Rhodobacter viridis]|uniref:ABC-type Fe3+/spermidine/putrescine transport system ATPase subunit n=1 Tax=Rhodobacter viridis TaxID=1054202 RepID=A0A318U1Y3_9RHOB|nr:ABC transporter ATP-binding protein [Rhodobacter viridis]PYF10052.1 ABC-type Fe3+/spermidine/putrescine transport system ATPase subunit [Rhodobacter viridis]